MEKDAYAVPVMSCAEAKAFERAFFSKSSEMTEEAAMTAAGTRVGEAILRECIEGKRDISRIFVLAGKGHNGGDALVAAMRIFSAVGCFASVVFFAESEEKLAPLTRKFLELFLASVPAEKRSVSFLTEASDSLPAREAGLVSEAELFIDGVFGHGFRPPFPAFVRDRLEEIDSLRSRDSLWCSVDLPSGLCDAGAEHCVVPADFTFPTGILKTPLLGCPEFVGRIVPVSIGFPGGKTLVRAVAGERYFLRKISVPRPVFCDKRDFGHVLIIGGSRTMPGALMLNVLAALRAGAGLVSAICPERVQPAFAARAPGAMWIPCTENGEGGLECDAAFAEFEKILPRVSAVLCGSGMGTSEGAQRLIRKIAAGTPAHIPLILDADALRTGTADALRERRRRFAAGPDRTVILPHAGEFSRIGGNPAHARAFCREHNLTLVLKGVCSRIVDAEEEWLTFPGTPALARGGSGDVLAGTVAAFLASPKNFADENAEPKELLLAAVILHGNAARKLAAAQGERGADIAALPEFFYDALA